MSNEWEKYKDSIDFKRIRSLVESYKQKALNGEIKRYNEEQTKNDFIRQLFKALGWNTDNNPNKNDRMKMEQGVNGKRADFEFSINDIPKIYVEAKSLKEDSIGFKQEYKWQAVNYAWLKSCSWAILTNFRTLIVYNADTPEGDWGYTLDIVNDFESRADKLYYISKNGFENNALDKWAENEGKKFQKVSVDKQLLNDLIHFRSVLSSDIQKNNQDKHLTQDELDESVQRTLDRLIFIRNAEDRGLENKRLSSNFRQWAEKERGNLIKRVRELYQEYKKSYNSGLFGRDDNDKHISDQVQISNDALTEVIQGLYSPIGSHYSYDFSLIEADVLGKMYEQYLGNILKQTPKRAKISESKAHRKEQGIYYTPSYIVDYIVKNTVGEYIKNHTPEEIEKVRILDPACGSGSFLIRAYQELENYWNEFYANIKGAPKSTKTVRQGRLEADFEEYGFYNIKAKILRNNIFGVDLDPKAVEIARLNLLLKISERKQKLPLLQENIKVGNSLIEDDNISPRAFEWSREFPEVMDEGGFDIIIGNPPYIRIQNLDDEQVEFFNSNYQSATKNYDIYALFVEKGMTLLKEGGFYGNILPSKFINAEYGVGLRKVISINRVLYKLVDFKDFQVFDEATTYTCLLFLRNSKNEVLTYSVPSSFENFGVAPRISDNQLESVIVKHPENGSGWVFGSKETAQIMKKLEAKNKTLGEISKFIFQGLVTGSDKIYFVKLFQKEGNNVEIQNNYDGQVFSVEEKIIKKLLKGKNIRKHTVNWEGLYVIYPYEVKNNDANLIELDQMKLQFPLALKYFEHYEKLLRSREENRFDRERDFYQFGRLQNIGKFEQPKLMTQVLASSNTFSIDEKGEFYFVGGGNAGGYGIILNEEYENYYLYMLALLNSNVLEFYLKNISTPFRGGYYSYGKRFIEKIPIAVSEKYFDSVSELSRKIVDIAKEIQGSLGKETDKKHKLEQDLIYFNHELNNIIYELYGLKDKEIEVIENKIKKVQIENS